MPGFDSGAATATSSVLVLSTPGFVPGSVSMLEGGTATFDVALAAPPTGGPVTVTVAASDTTVATVSPATLTFTAGDYSTAQTVTVTGVADADSADDTTTVTVSISGGGFNATAAVVVTVTEPTPPSLRVGPLGPVSVTEGDTGGIGVVLGSQPTAAVTVTVTVDDPTAATVNPASLTFTAGDYNIAQPVDVTGAVDTDNVNDTTNITITAAGGGYDTVTATVPLTVTEPTPIAIDTNPAAVIVTETLTAGFDVTLSAQPTADVVVTVASDNPAVATVLPASLTFTTSDYNATQSVSVTGTSDTNAANDTTNVTLTAAGGGYDTITATVPVTVNDTTVAALLWTPPTSMLTVAENANGNIAVALSTQPTADVVVTAASADGAIATITPATRTFTASDYATAQTFVVEGTDDTDYADASTTVTLTAAGGGYDTAAPVTVTVDVTDDDELAVVAAFTQTLYTIAEPRSPRWTDSADIEVTLTAAPQRTVTIPLVVTHDTTAADDFEGVPTELTFGPADTTATFTITALNEGNNVEPQERAQIAFGTLPSAVTAVTDTIDVHIVIRRPNTPPKTSRSPAAPPRTSSSPGTRSPPAPPPTPT